MSRFLLAILLVLSTCAVLTHGILIYKYSTIEVFMAEEETSDDKPVSKEGKDLGKEKIAFILNLYKYALGQKTHLFIPDNSSACSKGFYDKPYNPPEVI